MKQVKAMVLMMSDSHGVYIPHHVVDDMTDQWQGVSDEDRAICLAGPDHDAYWDAWDSILNNAYYIDDNGNKYTLSQDGDCWAICPQLMTNEEHANFFDEMKPAPDDAYEYQVCDNCIIALANDDYSGMHGADALAVESGLDELHAQYKQVIPDGAEYGFSHERCECCTGLAGDRYRVLCFDKVGD